MRHRSVFEIDRPLRRIFAGGFATCANRQRGRVDGGIGNQRDTPARTVKLTVVAAIHAIGVNDAGTRYAGRLDEDGARRACRQRTRGIRLCSIDTDFTVDDACSRDGKLDRAAANCCFVETIGADIARKSDVLGILRVSVAADAGRFETPAMRGGAVLYIAGQPLPAVTLSNRRNRCAGTERKAAGFNRQPIDVIGAQRLERQIFIALIVPNDAYGVSNRTSVNRHRAGNLKEFEWRSGCRKRRLEGNGSRISFRLRPGCHRHGQAVFAICIPNQVSQRIIAIDQNDERFGNIGARDALRPVGGR